MTAVLKLFIRVYKVLLSPLLPFNHCRYYPSCSAYALEAVDKYGAFKGLWLALKRIGRCHPLSKREAYDPVP